MRNVKWRNGETVLPFCILPFYHLRLPVRWQETEKLEYMAVENFNYFFFTAAGDHEAKG
jgi:hypothetical protein